MDKPKICSKCKIIKPLCEFNKRGDLDTYRSHCKKCASIGNSKRNMIKYDKIKRKHYYIKNKKRENYINNNNYAKNHGKNCLVIDRKNKRKELIKKQYLRKNKNAYLKRTYGITINEYEQKLINQNNCCAICGLEQKDKKLSVDHCHKTNKVRDLLCSYCNFGIGLFFENEELLINAINYLKGHKL